MHISFFFCLNKYAEDKKSYSLRHNCSNLFLFNAFGFTSTTSNALFEYIFSSFSRLLDFKSRGIRFNSRVGLIAYYYISFVPVTFGAVT